LEAASGFEPLNKGFADLCLTTWLRRRLIWNAVYIKFHHVLSIHFLGLCRRYIAVKQKINGLSADQGNSI
jgi:hypothetical protein